MMTAFTLQILASIGLSFCLFFTIWLTTVKTKDLSLIDGFWGVSFILPFLVNFYFEGFNHGNIIMFSFVLLWSLRLSLFLALRLKTTKGDQRYEGLSRNWQTQNFALNALSFVVLPQFIAHLLMCACFYVYLFSPNAGWSAPFWNLPLAILFLIGFIIESLADHQHKKFKNQPENKNKTYTGGLWRFVKYPNYLGEILIWLSFGLLALPFQYGVFGLISPFIITYALIFKTGIPYLEQKRSTQKSAPHSKRPKYYLIPGLF